MPSTTDFKGVVTAQPFEVLRVEVLKSGSELESVRSQWDDLARAAGNPLLLNDWFVAAARAFHADDGLHVVAVWSGNRLVAAAPLAVRTIGGIARLEFIGSSALGEPCEVIARSEQDAAFLGTWLGRCGRPLVFARVDPAGPSATALNSTAKRWGWVFRLKGSRCMWVNTSTDWHQYLEKRSAQCRSGYQRKRRKLKEIGVERFESIKPTASALDDLLQEAFEVEADGWKSVRGSAILNRPPMRQFVRDLCGRFARRGWIRMSFMRAGETAVAMQIAIEYADALWEVKVGYREKYADASPGMIVLWETMRECFSSRLCRYEFLGSGDAQQLAWATDERKLQTLLYYPGSVRGVLALAWDAGLRLWAKLPVPRLGRRSLLAWRMFRPFR